MAARGWEYLGPDGPGPGFFPLWYGVAMIALGLLLTGMSWAQRGREPKQQAADWRASGRVITAWAAFAVCVGLLNVVGFLTAFALFTLFVVAVMYRRPVVPALAVAVGGALVFYLLFPVALNVSLPTGWFGF